MTNKEKLEYLLKAIYANFDNIDLDGLNNHNLDNLDYLEKLRHHALELTHFMNKLKDTTEKKLKEVLKADWEDDD